LPAVETACEIFVVKASQKREDLKSAWAVRRIASTDFSLDGIRAFSIVPRGSRVKKMHAAAGIEMRRL
jgi:hypothetical protein